jgi:hypothetical protein
VIQCFPEALEVEDISLLHELQSVRQIRVIGQAEQILIGCLGFFCWLILKSKTTLNAYCAQQEAKRTSLCFL